MLVWILEDGVFVIERGVLVSYLYDCFQLDWEDGIVVEVDVVRCGIQFDWGRLVEVVELVLIGVF